jgi:hypothetical protein
MINLKDIQYFRKTEVADSITIFCIDNRAIKIELEDDVGLFDVDNIMISKKPNEYSDIKYQKKYIIPQDNILYFSVMYKD